jgi:hypothetical protein
MGFALSPTGRDRFSSIDERVAAEMNATLSGRAIPGFGRRLGTSESLRHTFGQLSKELRDMFGGLTVNFAGFDDRVAIPAFSTGSCRR